MLTERWRHVSRLSLSWVRMSVSILTHLSPVSGSSTAWLRSRFLPDRDRDLGLRDFDKFWSIGCLCWLSNWRLSGVASWWCSWLCWEWWSSEWWCSSWWWWWCWWCPSLLSPGSRFEEANPRNSTNTTDQSCKHSENFSFYNEQFCAPEWAKDVQNLSFRQSMALCYEGHKQQIIEKTPFNNVLNWSQARWLYF